MLTLYRDNINKFFDDVLDWHSTIWEGFVSPTVERQDLDNGISYLIDVPGFSKNELSITQKGRVITVVGERKGRAYNKSIHTSFNIDAACEPTSLTANLENGVLTLMFYDRSPPQLEERKIEISENK